MSTPVTRIAVACAGDPAVPERFSGIPAALLVALEGLGVEAVPLAAEPSRPVLRTAINAMRLARLRPHHLLTLRASLESSHWAVSSTPVLALARSLAASADLRRAGALDGVIQYGTEFRLPRGTRYVTYEDSTVHSAASAYDWPWLAERESRRLNRWAGYATARYAGATACCFTNHWAAGSAIADHGVPPEKVRVVGIGHNHVPPTPERDWSVPHYLFVGLDWKRKNGDGLLRAFARLRAELPDATLDLVGGHPPVDQPGVRAHGRLPLTDPEARRRVEALYASATCFVLPSLHEPSAISHVEAGVAGLPSIGSAVGGVGTIVGDGGLLVDPLDDDSILAAMRALADPDTAARMGAAAKERSALFTWRAVVERLLDALGARTATVPDVGPAELLRPSLEL